MFSRDSFSRDSKRSALARRVRRPAALKVFECARQSKMKPATKHWLFLILLAVTLAGLVALVLWQIDKARRERGTTKYEIRMTNALSRMYNV